MAQGNKAAVVSRGWVGHSVDTKCAKCSIRYGIYTFFLQEGSLLLHGASLDTRVVQKGHCQLNLRTTEETN